MASPATLATLGGARASPSGGLDCCSSLWITYSNCLLTRRWAHGVCKCMVRTDLMEKGSTESAIRGASSPISGASSISKDENSDIILKPAPKPVLSARPSSPVEPVSPTPWSPANEGQGKGDRVAREVLEKAEKLEASTSVKLTGREAKTEGRLNNNSPRVGKPEPESSALRKSKTLKSVWRKGSPTANVEKVVKEVQKVNKEPEEGSQLPPVAESRRSDAQPRAPSELSPFPICAEFTGETCGGSPSSSACSEEECGADSHPYRQVCVQEAAVDPIIEQAVLVPMKQGKGPPPSKVKEERRRKSNTAGDASELDVSIPGATAKRTGRKWSKASRKAAKLKALAAAAPVKVEILEVGEEGMLIEDLAYSLAISEADILSYLFAKGVNPDMASTLNKDMVKMICKEYEVEVIEAEEVKVEQMAKKKEVFDEEDLDLLEERPPVITIMGHVDHGKTSLLDYIRKSKVVASEAGGITQGIGAYKVEVPFDEGLHTAFGAMRARGARVTDIAIIVVAADDGVRPQTSEAIAHAKAAGVPIIVAINKIDKDGANPDRVMQELSSVGLMPEDWGGNVPMVKNVDELLETVMLVAELQELKANPHRNARGTVIEAGLEKSKGPMATFIVQNGTLKKGDVVVCGEAFGKVRALFDDRGKRVDDAGPSMAVQVIGLNNVPIAGDEFEVVDSLDAARERADACAESLRAARISAKVGEGKVTLSSIASAVSAGGQSGLDMHQLNIILKVDVQGSIEAIRHAIQVLPQDNVTLNTSDVDLAVAAEAIIIGFNVKAPGSVKSHADKWNVEIRLYRVIYDLIDDLRKAMEGLLEPIEEQVPIGSAEVRKVFSSGSGRVAGCMVADGKLVKDCGIKVVRRGKTVYTGKLDSLRRVKEEVKECGIGVDEYMDWEVGDVIEAFNSVKRRRSLEEASASVTAALSGAGVQV
ncbi:unnamed protein product [Spirodela intermedia]|uniref:Translation initiation factor IF-2, chloroplastic n=1 Tax=Spirodela intermedia TaxID=51605 RepID=A0A7I8IJE9_SPIIN|nr:unnamed protein product [Spirodela intermedia]CAA6657890.1 unnamed protein product [Spirodela intermedia]